MYNIVLLWLCWHSKEGVVDEEVSRQMVLVGGGEVSEIELV